MALRSGRGRKRSPGHVPLFIQGQQEPLGIDLCATFAPSSSGPLPVSPQATSSRSRRRPLVHHLPLKRRKSGEAFPVAPRSSAAAPAMARVCGMLKVDVTGLPAGAAPTHECPGSGIPATIPATQAPLHGRASSAARAVQHQGGRFAVDMKATARIRRCSCLRPSRRR